MATLGTGDKQAQRVLDHEAVNHLEDFADDAGEDLGEVDEVVGLLRPQWRAVDPLVAQLVEHLV